jgi:hypothetical protein
MDHRWCIVGVALFGLVPGCRRAPAAADLPIATVRPLFGPVIPREVIGGRTDDGRGRLWLLAAGEAIVTVDLHAGVASRTSIATRTAGSCWGLARLDDGSLWTLVGRDTLAQIAGDGRIAREIPLPEPHFCLYARGDRLVYQPARFVQSGGLLFAGVPGDPNPKPWSEIEPRSFPALARASAAALNMIACGVTRTAEQPCWFPDDTAVALVGPAGQTRRLELAGLTRVPPEVLLTSDNPAKPLRDVCVDETGAIWVLSSGSPRRAEGDAPGGWLLGQYTAAGTLVGLRQLSEAVRLILNVDRDRLVVLSGAGMVAEVWR